MSKDVKRIIPELELIKFVGDESNKTYMCGVKDTIKNIIEVNPNRITLKKLLVKLEKKYTND